MGISARPWRKVRALSAQQLAMQGSVTCARCGDPVRFDEPFDVDHIHPRSADGTDAISNLGIAHPGCNRAIHANLNHGADRPPAPPPSRDW